MQKHTCTFKKTGMIPARQYMCSCLDCFHGRDLICLSCAKKCHTNHHTTPPKLVNNICQCGARNMCGAHKIDSRNFELPLSALDWMRMTQLENENVPERQNLIARKFDVALSRPAQKTKFEDRGTVFNINTREAEQNIGNDTIYSRKTSNYATITNVNTKKHGIVPDIRFGDYTHKKDKHKEVEINPRMPEELQIPSIFEETIPDLQDKPESSPEIDLLSDINNEFSIELLNHYLQALPNNKILLSPFNIIAILAVLYRGSVNNTSDEIKGLISCPDKETMFKLINASRYLLKLINAYNSLFINNFSQINHSYQQTVQTIATINKLNTDKANEVNRINQLIMQQTNSQIALLTPEFVNSNTNILAINIAHLSLRFEQGFDAGKDEPFYNHQTRMLHFMRRQQNKQLYTEDSMNQLLEFKCNDILGFGILLPKNKITLPQLDWAVLKLYLENLKETPIAEIKIPKFCHMSQFDLRQMFEKMGAKHMFYNADFSIISNEKLNISSILHQTFINVDRDGGIPIMTDTPSNIKFIANHPFIYYIRHVTTNLILYVGAYQ